MKAYVQRLVPIAVAAGLFAGHGMVQSQAYPSKPVRVVTTDVGGSSDFFLRLMSSDLATHLGQQVIIDNRPGSGAAPGEIVAKSPADGYTLLFFTSNLWITPLLQKTTYDPIKDFAPISQATRANSVLVVTPTLPAKDVKGLIALAKSRPGELNYAHGSPGSASHLAGALFRSMTGINMVNIPYKGSAQALVDVMSGQTQLMFPNAAVVPPHIKSGRLRALAVTSASPSPMFPGLPTVAATVPGFESGTMNGMFAPVKTPEAIVRRLNQELVRFVNSPEVKDRLTVGGIEPVGSSPAEFATAIATDIKRWGKVIREANISID